MIGPAPMCVTCSRYRPGEGGCDAYPDGIPTEIIMNAWDHRVAKPGDHGLQYDPKPGAEWQEWWPDELIPGFVEYDTLNPKQKETLNFHTVAALLAQRGYDSMRLHDDWSGADFIAVHVDGHTRRIQLKARIEIAKKYSGKGLDIAFPAKDVWYLVPHDTLVDVVARHASTWLDSKSWTTKQETYNSIAPSAALLSALSPYALTPRPQGDRR